MKTFEIYENGVRFAVIEALTGVSALRKATREYPRRASDYNVSRGEEFVVVWRACELGRKAWAASADVTVPGNGSNGCTFYDAH